ncbi:MAG: polysaccharide biosynthesis C-terminal domain-containing protein [Flavobacteriaceae bacterium]|nr:polysaccharide biosynthesis C-terminal domain-containing protein [Flavobacteriaceae bacterium]
MSTLKRFFKDTIIYGIAAVLPRAINILLVRLHTHTLTSDKYAENTIYFVYAAYFNAILTHGMETAFFRFFTKEKDKGKVVSTAFISLFTSTLFFLIIMLFYSNEIVKYFGFAKPIYFQILILVTTFDTLVVLPFAYLRAMNKPIKFTFYKILNISIYTLINLYFLLYVPYAIKNGYFVPQFISNHFEQNSLVIYIFIANLVASFITLLLLSPIFFKFKFTFDKKLLYKMLNYGLPIMIGSLAFVTNENLDKLLIPKYLGKDQMGIYAACYKLGVFMMLYVMAFRLGAEPFFFNHAKEKNAKETYATILNWFTIIGTIFLLIIIVFIDVFANMLLGKEEYFQALKIVPIILLANLFLGIYINLSVWYKLTDKTRYGMYFSVIGAIITIGFNIIFIPKIGYMASAWATLIAYIFMTVVSYFYGKKYYTIPYKIKNIALYLFLSTGFTYLSFSFFRGNLFISSLLVIIFVGFIMWNEKKEIQKILKNDY